jgi:hypothetical protein
LPSGSANASDDIPKDSPGQDELRNPPQASGVGGQDAEATHPSETNQKQKRNKKKKAKKISLSTFQAMCPVITTVPPVISPTEQLKNSPALLVHIRSLLSPVGANNTFKPRPCLVFSIEDGGKIHRDAIQYYQLQVSQDQMLMEFNSRMRNLLLTKSICSFYTFFLCFETQDLKYKQ